MALIIKYKTVHHLSDEEFEFLRSQKKGGEKRKLNSQLSFEKLVIKKGFSFQDSYLYESNRDDVDLICPDGHLASTTPSNFKDPRTIISCKKCAGTCPEEAVTKLKSSLSRNGWLLTTDFNSIKEEITITCENGHSRTLTAAHYKGDGCYRCSLDVYIIDGVKYLGYAGLAEAFKKDRYVVGNRIANCGWTARQAVDLEPPPEKSTSVEFRGIKYPSLSKLAEAYNQKYHTFFDRLHVQKFTLEQALGLEEVLTGSEVFFEDEMFPSFEELARTYQVNRVTLRDRIERGWTMREALGLDPKPMKQNNVIEFGGIKYESRRHLAEAFDIDAGAFYARLDRGWSLEQALGLEEPPLYTPPKGVNGKPVAYNGVTYCSLSELCEKHGKSRDRVSQRLYYGWSLDEALDVVERPFVSGFDNHKPAFLYIQEICLNGALVAYKVGKTNRAVEDRIKQQKLKSIYEHIEMCSTFSQSGSEVSDLETKIKNIIPMSYLSKEDMEDGYTETFSPKYLDKVLSLFFWQYSS